MPTKTKTKTKGRLCQKVFIGLFVTALGLAFPVFNIFSSQLSMDNHENRLLTTLPEALSAPLQEIPSRLDAFLVDNSPFRYQLVMLNAEVDYRVFGVTESNQVLLGKDGWMFYKTGPNAATPLADYQGLVRYDDATLAALAQNLQRCSDALAANGGRLILNITPGKDRICREYVPERYPIVNEETLSDQVYAYLKENSNVPVVYSADALREYTLKSAYPTFFKTDTHWNHLGALLALDDVLNTTGLATPNFDEYDFAFSRTQAGDMANVTALYGVFEDEPDYEPLTYDFDVDERTVGVFGDSFSLYYMDYLSRRFANSWRQDLAAANCAAIANCGAQVVILEANTRSLDALCAVLAQ